MASFNVFPPKKEKKTNTIKKGKDKKIQSKSKIRRKRVRAQLINGISNTKKSKNMNMIEERNNREGKNKNMIKKKSNRNMFRKRRE